MITADQPRVLIAREPLELAGVVHPDAIKAALKFADHFMAVAMAASSARIEVWDDGTFSDKEHADARIDYRKVQGEHAELEHEFCRWWAPSEGFDGPVRAIAATLAQSAASGGEDLTTGGATS